MADDMEPVRKPSGLRTFLWGIATLALIAGAIILTTPTAPFIPLVGAWLGAHSSVLWGLRIALPLMGALKTWKSHRENQAIIAENAMLAQQGMNYNDGLSQEQQVARARERQASVEGLGGDRRSDWSQNVGTAAERASTPQDPGCPS